MAAAVIIIISRPPPNQQHAEESHEVHFIGSPPESVDSINEAITQAHANAQAKS